MKITIFEIAKKAGVSIATISRAMNPHTRGMVAPDTLKRINNLLTKYTYTPNLAARNLRQASTRTIGVVVPFYRDIFYNSYYMHILSGVSNTLEGSGYQFKLLALDQGQLWDHYDFRSGEQVDGLIVSLWFRFFSGKEVLEKIKVPTVVIDDFEKDVKAMFIGGDHVSGGRMAAEHLYTRGHRRVAVITGPDWSRDCRQRVDGFRSYWAAQGLSLDQDQVIAADFLHHKAKASFDQIIKKDPEVTAIFCCTDIMAGGVLERCQELNMACPRDISVVGYDDDMKIISRFPYLSSVHVPVYEMAQKAASGILEHLKSKRNKKFFNGTEFLPVRLVERQSVKTTG
ncbi:MAG: LacI family DNA-binding transcriptional regulator [Candidatus Omnitrophota bacterium]